MNASRSFPKVTGTPSYQRLQPKLWSTTSAAALLAVVVLLAALVIDRAAARGSAHSDSPREVIRPSQADSRPSAADAQLQAQAQLQVEAQLQAEAQRLAQTQAQSKRPTRPDPSPIALEAK